MTPVPALTVRFAALPLKVSWKFEAMERYLMVEAAEIKLLPEEACTWSALPGVTPPVQLDAVPQLPSTGADEFQLMLAACVSRIETRAMSAIAAGIRRLPGKGESIMKEWV